MNIGQNKKQEDLDFEIKFFEGVIQRQPNFIEALMALGDHYTKKGMYEEGLKIDERLAQLRPRDPIVIYNLACSYSLTHDLDKAFEAIKHAIDLGYHDLDYLLKDEDLKDLREDARFQEFFAKTKSKKSKS